MYIRYIICCVLSLVTRYLVGRSCWRSWPRQLRSICGYLPVNHALNDDNDDDDGAYGDDGVNGDSDDEDAAADDDDSEDHA